jgi:hypothetical protein
VERLKLRRAVDGLMVILADLEDGERPTRHPEHTELEQVARAVADRIATLR